MDEQQVEPVAHAEPVDARLDQAQRHLGVGRRVDVEHPAAFGMSQHPDALERGDVRQAARRLAAAAEDHERNRMRQRDERDRAVARRPRARARPPRGVRLRRQARAEAPRRRAW